MHTKEEFKYIMSEKIGINVYVHPIVEIRLKPNLQYDPVVYFFTGRSVK